MIYLILILVVVILLIQVKTSKSVYTASKRTNALFVFFIKNNKFNEETAKALRDVIDPNDDGGCAELVEEMKESEKK